MLLLFDAAEPGVGLRGPQDVFDGDDVVVRAEGPQERDLAEGAPGVGGVVEGAGDLKGKNEKKKKKGRQRRGGEKARGGKASERRRRAKNKTNEPDFLSLPFSQPRARPRLRPSPRRRPRTRPCRWPKVGVRRKRSRGCIRERMRRETKREANQRLPFGVDEVSIFPFFLDPFNGP